MRTIINNQTFFNTNILNIKIMKTNLFKTKNYIAVAAIIATSLFSNISIAQHSTNYQVNYLGFVGGNNASGYTGEKIRNSFGLNGNNYGLSFLTNQTERMRIDLNGTIGIFGGNALEFGGGLTKQADAGKICYGCFSNGNQLHIVGAGTTAGQRKIKLWDKVWIGDAILSAGNTYSLYVSRGVVSEDYVLANVAAWSDYVFAKDYKLPTLKETEAYILANKHLPNVPSEEEVKKNGYSLHDMNNSFLKTIEEMTLHSIAQEKKIEEMTLHSIAQEKKIEEMTLRSIAQEKKIEALTNEIAEIKALLSKK
jgi:hypothetical protein